MNKKTIYLLCALALLIVITGLAVGKVSAQDQGNEPIAIASAAGGANEESIVLNFADPTQTQAVYYLFLRNTSTEPLTGLTFALVNLKKNITGELAGGYNVTFKIGETSVPVEGVSLAAGQTLVLRMELDNFAQEGEFIGEFVVNAGENPVASSQFVVRRMRAATLPPTPTAVITPTPTPNPTLAIAGFGATGVTLTQILNTETYELQIYSTNDTPLENVGIHLQSFVKEGVAPVQPENINFKASDGSVLPAINSHKIGGLDQLLLSFTLTLPEAGDYTGHIRLSYNHGQISYPITIKRVRQTIPVEVVGLGDKLLGVSSLRVPVRFYLHETRGGEFSVNPPTLVLNRRESDTITKGDLLISPPVTLCPSDESVPSREPMTIRSSDSKDPMIQIPGMEYLCVEMDMAKMKRGEYNGQVLVSSPDGVTVSEDIQVLVRHPGWIAFLILLTGIGLSFLIRWFLKKWQPVQELRLGVLEKISAVQRLRKQIPEHGGEYLQPENSLFLDLEERLAEIYAGVDSDTLAELKTEVEIHQKTIDDHRNLLDLGNAFAWLTPALRERFDEQRKENLRLLLNVSQAGNARTKIEDLRKSVIPAAIKDWITNRMSTLDAGTQSILNGGEPPYQPWAAKKSAFLSGLKDKIEPEEKLETALRSTWGEYSKLLHWISETSLTHNAKLKEEAYAEVLEQIKEIHRRSGEDALTGENISELDGLYEKTLEQYANIGIKSNGLNTRSTLGAYAASGLMTPALRMIPDPKGEYRWLKRRVTNVNAAIKFIAALIAAISGLVILYEPNTTWGAWPDYLIALLWGLGLYEASSTTLVNFEKNRPLEDLLKDFSGTS